MTDPLRDTADGKRRKPVNWLKGRSDRKEYWAYIVGVIAIYMALSLVGFDAGSGASAGVTFVIQIRRFHDLGRSGWWALALLVAQIAVSIPLLFLGPIGLMLAVLVGLAVLVAMGAIPGQPFENRYGPPRGQRPLSQVFS